MHKLYTMRISNIVAMLFWEFRKCWFFFFQHEKYLLKVINKNTTISTWNIDNENRRKCPCHRSIFFIVNFEHYIVFDVDLELCDERWLVKDDFLKKCEKQVQRGVFFLTKLLQLMVIETLLEQFWVNTYICVNLMLEIIYNKNNQSTWLFC